MRLLSIIALASIAVSRPVKDGLPNFSRLSISSPPDDSNDMMPELRKSFRTKKTRNPVSTVPSDVRLKDPVQVLTVDCKIENTQLCDKAVSATIDAGKRIAKILHFYKPIQIKVTVDPCTDAMTRKDSCGFAALNDARLLLARSNEETEWTRYPTALLKQLHLKKEPKWPEIDMEITFNERYKFWSKNDGGPIRQDEMDIEHIAAHELTHGLGFVSFMKVEEWQGRQLLSPVITKAPNNSQFYIMSPPSGYDRLLFDPKTGKSLMDIAKPLVGKEIDLSNVTALQEALRIGTKLLSISKNRIAIRLSTQNTDAQFRISRIYPNRLSNETLSRWETRPISFVEAAKLQSILQFHKLANAYVGKEFKEGASFCHLEEAYELTPNFLMSPKVDLNMGLSLDTIIRVNSLDWQINTYGVYGYELAKIMTDIGWPSVIDPTRKKLVPQHF